MKLYCKKLKCPKLYICHSKHLVIYYMPMKVTKVSFMSYNDLDLRSYGQLLFLFF